MKSAHIAYEYSCQHDTMFTLKCVRKYTYNCLHVAVLEKELSGGCI